MTALIVDDNAELAENLREVIEEESFVCWLALDADEALQRLRGESRPPDVILADLRMPGMPVEDLLSIVRAAPGWSHVAFVLMTAGIEGDVPPGIPVDGVLMKPFGIEALLQTLRSAIEGRRSGENRAEAS